MTRINEHTFRLTADPYEYQALPIPVEVVVRPGPAGVIVDFRLDNKDIGGIMAEVVGTDPDRPDQNCTRLVTRVWRAEDINDPHYNIDICDLAHPPGDEENKNE